VTRKRGNPNWGKPDLTPTAYTGVTSFEGIVKQLRLSPDQYIGSRLLRAWVQKNKDRKYVPLDLLTAWDLETKDDSET